MSDDDLDLRQLIVADKYPFTSQKLTEFCNYSSSGMGAYATPSTCFEAKDTSIGESLDTAVLYAEGVRKIHDTVYLDEVHSLFEAFMNYDEPVYPIPVGAGVFYIVMISWMISFYIAYFGRKAMARCIDELKLFPDPMRFPNIPLYWLQQTKKEAELRREVRNTWAWLAKRHLLSPNDPMLKNIDQVLGHVNWHDFEVSRNTQSLINCILHNNALFLKVRKNGEGEIRKREFELLRDTDLTHIPMEGDQVKRIFEEIPEKVNIEVEETTRKLSKASSTGSKRSHKRSGSPRATIDHTSEHEENKIKKKKKGKKKGKGPAPAPVKSKTSAKKIKSKTQVEDKPKKASKGKKAEVSPEADETIDISATPVTEVTKVTEADAPDDGEKEEELNPPDEDTPAPDEEDPTADAPDEESTLKKKSKEGSEKPDSEKTAALEEEDLELVTEINWENIKRPKRYDLL